MKTYRILNQFTLDHITYFEGESAQFTDEEAASLLQDGKVELVNSNQGQ